MISRRYLNQHMLKKYSIIHMIRDVEVLRRSIKAAEEGKVYEHDLAGV